MGVFDDILKTAKDEDKAVLDKYPQLRQSIEKLEADGVKAAEQLTTVQGQLTANQEKLGKWDDRLKQWEAWKTSTWDEDAGMTKAEVEARKQAVELQAKIEELQAGGGEGLEGATAEEIAKSLERQGYIKKADLEKTVEHLVNQEGLQQSHNRLAAGFELLYNKGYNLGLRHNQEFGEFLNIEDVHKFMSEHQIGDPDKAWNEMVAPKRAEIATAKAEEAKVAQEKAVTDARKEGVEQGKQEAVMSQGGRMPIDQTGPGPSMGHLQRSVLADADKDKDVPKLPDAPLGSNVLAHAGYKEWLEKQQTTGKVQ